MKRCLIADASEIIRKVARHYLEQMSYEVLEASSADEALALCREHSIDALILDWRLPGKTPVEFLSALRFAGDAKRRPLVIYATSENDPADISRDATFEDLDVDSLDLAELSQIIEDEFGVQLKGDDVGKIKTVGDAVDLVVSRAG